MRSDEAHRGPSRNIPMMSSSWFGCSRYVLILLAGTVLAVAATLPFYYRVEQNDRKVCNKTGQPMTMSQLREIAINEIVSEKVRFANARALNANEFVWVSDNISDIESVRALMQASKPEKPFRENLELTGVHDASAEFSKYRAIVDNLVDEDTFTVVLVDSIGISEDKTAKSLIDRYRGFGNYSLEYSRGLFFIGCCDNKRRDKSRSWYLDRNLNSMAHDMGVTEFRLAISNCGEIRTY